MITLPRAVPAALLTAAAVLVFAAPAHAQPTAPMVPSSIGPIPASAAMPRGDEAVHPDITCYDSGQPGGSIAQSTVLARAAVWVSQNVPYTGQCAQEPGGNYRLDCSGFVSMTWGLSTSLSTVDFNPATNGGDSRFPAIPRASLVPGDAVVADNNTAHHIALFTGWGSNDNGQHRYANLSQESTYNVGTIAVYNQDLLGNYWGAYTPIRYVNVQAPVATPGASTVYTGTSHTTFYIGTAGQVMSVDSSDWTTKTDLGGVLTGAPAASYHGGQYDVFAVSAAGILYLQSSTATGWTGWHRVSVGQGQFVPGVSVVWNGTRNDVFGHNGSGHLLHVWLNGSSWQLEDLGGTTVGTPGVVYRNGGWAVFAVSPATTMLMQLTSTANGWSPWQATGDAGRWNSVGVTAGWTGSTCHVFASSAAHGMLYRLWRGSQWSYPQPLNGSYPGTVGVDFDGHNFRVFAPRNGGLYYSHTTMSGGWTAWLQVV